MSTETLAILVAIIGCVGTILKIVYPLILARFTESQINMMKDTVEVAIFAAEKIFDQVGQGASKKEFVVNYITELYPDLAEKDLEVLIEAIGVATGIIKLEE